MAENIAKERREDALELALLVYDIYKEYQSSDTVEDGQNNANQTENN